MIVVVFKKTSKANNGANTDNPVNSLDNVVLQSKNLKEILGHSSDIIFREIYINGDKNLPVTIAFVDGLIDTKLVDDFILKPLMQECSLSKVKSLKETIDLIQHGTVYSTIVKVRSKTSDLVNDILNAYTALIFDSEKRAVTVEVKGYEKRQLSEPLDESVLNASKDAFIEDLRTNTALVRRKIKNPNLVIEETNVGRQTRTAVAVAYIKGLANEDIAKELKKRLDSIKVDNVLTIGFITKYISDSKYSIFPQEVTTERTDGFCANLVEGRFGIIIDGIPIGIIIPATFMMFMQSPEDYTDSTYVNSFKRLLRYVLLVIGLLLPSFYIAVTEFHHELIPSKLAFSIATARSGVPFPAFIEVLLMVLAFEVLIEASLRLPRTVGQAISIVGGIIIGEAAVQAKIASPIVIIVVALTGIAVFTMPAYYLANAVRLLRLFIIIFASIAGLYGIAIALLLIFYHACTIEMFGVPYLAPFAANEGRDLKDSILRLPYSWLKKRPSYLKTTNRKRQE